ncbi:hypothetical protein [Ruthenibacterium lactatiformans]|uniref:hypothetical protein n=1 Tax=Ruthenibacterium lactatiformans TaxID=1550024 RepID=UPI00351FD768
MRKKLLSVVLALAMVLSLMPMAWAEKRDRNSDRAGEPGCGQGCDADARGYGAAV